MSDVRAEAIKEINAATAIKEGIKLLTDDDDAIRDTLDGETDLAGIIRSLILSIDEDKILLDGCSNRVDELNERKTRFKSRIEAKRGLIALAMETAEWTKKELDLATVSLNKGAKQLRVTEEADIPAKYWNPADPTLDKKQLLADLKADKIVPGAELSNAAPVLHIRKV